MPIKIDCPRCKKPLAVPGKKAGSYVACPNCSGRFWVPADAPNQPAQASALSDATPSTSSVTLAVPPPVAGSPSGVAKSFLKPIEPPPAPPREAVPRFRTPPPPPARQDASEPPAAPARKVAKFITAEAAQSTLKLADDGKLPELHLDDGQAKGSRQTTQTSVNPLVLFALMSMSVVLSLVMVFIEPGSGEPSNSEQQARARYIIQTDYFADEEHLKLDNPPPLKPYQRLLRDALEAHARGDYKAEQQRYRQVLKLLRAERSEFEGATGSPARDRVLEKQLTILLSGQ